MPDIPVDCQPDELLIIYQYVEINLKTLEAAQGFRSRSMQSSQVVRDKELKHIHSLRAVNLVVYLSWTLGKCKLIGHKL